MKTILYNLNVDKTVYDRLLSIVVIPAWLITILPRIIIQGGRKKTSDCVLRFNLRFNDCSCD